MKRVKYTDKQLVDVLDLQNSQDLVNEHIKTFIKQVTQVEAVTSGLQVVPTLNPSGKYVEILTGFALNAGEIIKVTSSQLVNILDTNAGSTTPEGRVIWGRAITPSSTYNKYVSIGIKHKEVEGELTTKWFIDDTQEPPVEYQNEVFTRYLDYLEITLVEGQATATPSPPVMTEGYIRLANILIKPSMTVIVTGDIYNTRPVLVNTTTYLQELEPEGVGSNALWFAVV